MPPSARHLVTIGVTDPDIPEVSHSIDLVTNCLATLGYRQALPELVNLQPGVDVKGELSKWAQTVAPEDFTILYFAGHGGTVKGRHYLGLPNTDWRFPAAQALATDDLFRTLAEAPCLTRLLVVLDTCYSGQGALDAQRISDVLQGDDEMRSFWIIAASRPKQEAGDGDFAVAFNKYMLQKRGRAIPRYELSTLIQDLNSALKSSQRAKYAVVGLASDEPDFLPNPAFLSTALLNRSIEDRRFFLDNQKPLWRLRAIGSETIFGGGQWYFTGRLNALARIVSWLKATGDGNGLIVTGNPGSGKSALLGFLNLASDARELEEPGLKSLVASIPETSRPIAGSIAFALVLRGTTLADTISTLSERFATTPDRVMAVLTTIEEPTVLLFDGLDESLEPKEIADRLLRPLTGYANLKVIVGTRRPEINFLGGRFEPIDLDSSSYRNNSDVAVYVERLLLAEGEPRITPYRNQPLNARQVANAVADRADGNFLVAQTVARTLIERPAMIDLSLEQLPANMPEAFSGYLNELAQRAKRDETSFREDLAPLAYVRGQGLPLEIWQLFTATNVAVLLELASAFIVESVEEGRTVYRLYHQALADALRDPKLDSERQRTMANALYGAIPERDWLKAHWYTRKYFSLFASAGTLDLLERAVLDVKFLVVANTPLLLTAGKRIRLPESKRRFDWLKLAAERLKERDEGDRLSNLQMVALQNNAHDLAALCQNVIEPRNWRPKWARWSVQATPHRLLSGHTDTVNSVAIADGIAVSGSDDYTVRFWNAISGEAVGEVAKHENKVTSVAIHGEVAVSAGWDDTIRLWDGRTGKPKGSPMVGHQNRVLAVAISENMAASGDGSGVIYLWDIETATRIAGPLQGHVGGIAALAVADGTVISGGQDGTVRFWKKDGTAASKTLIVSGAVTALTVKQMSIAVVANYHVVHQWDLTGTPVGGTLTLEPIVNTVGIADGILALGCGDFKIRLLDFATSEERGVLIGHSLFVRSVAAERRTLVSGASDSTVRIWDVDSTSPLGKPDPDMHRGCGSVAATSGLAITTSWELPLQIWDLDTGELKGSSNVTPQFAKGGGVPITAGDGLVAFNGKGNSISIYDLETGAVSELAGNFSPADLLAISEGVFVSASSDRKLRRWDLHSRNPIGDVTDTGTFTSALTVEKGVIWVHGPRLQRFDLHTGELMEPSYDGLDQTSCLSVNSEIAVSGHWDGSVSTRDAATGNPLRRSARSPQRRINVIVNYKDSVVSGSPDGSLCIWNPRTLEPRYSIQLGSPVNGLSATENGVCVACAAGITFLEIAS